MSPANTIAMWRSRLPRGEPLPPESWAKRHRAMTAIAWAHVPALALFAILTGDSPSMALMDVTPIAVFAWLAGRRRLTRNHRAAAMSLALLTCSAVLVHVWDGRIEAHFHYFVMVALLATYEQWFPYLVAIVYVLVTHGLMGALAATSVYDHPDAQQHPWRWAAIHALFISALGIVNIVSWRMNEDAREDSRDSDQRFRSAFEDAPIGMALVDLDGVVQRVNDRLCDATLRSQDELLGRPLDVLVPREDRDGAWPPAAGVETERRFERGDGSAGWGLWQHSLVRNRDGAPGYWICHFLDISKRKGAERRLDHQAHHDPLTGLPNRTFFLERLREAIAAEGTEEVAVLFVDLDNFKIINDSLGHEAGDRLLEVVAERLRRVLRPGDVIARFGGDEFAVMIPGPGGEQAARRLADRLAGVLRTPVKLDGRQRFVTASFGIRALPVGLADPEALLRDADAAMYHAKELGKARFATFDESMRERATERLDLESGLRHALRRGELRLLYQPQIDMSSGCIVGAEALIRWHHPERGVLGPPAFVPIAEQTGMIVPIGAWVVEQACRQAAEWARTVDRPFTVCVNVSPRQLSEGDFTATVRDALVASDLEPALLCLEITESAVLADPDAATEVLERLKALGVRMAIDDFGIGYSSLSQLKALLPVDTIKIDKSFVDGVTGDGEDCAIVAAVVRLAAGLRLSTIAEGVETPEQVEALLELGCRLCQGFHYARPQTSADLDRLLAIETLTV